MAPQLNNSAQRWGVVAQTLHWVVVWAIVTQFVLAEVAEDLPDGLAKLATLAQHKSVGITILVLAALRLAWRARQRGRSPALPAKLRPWEKPLAHLTHHGLYLLLFVVPLTGWMMSSARNYPVSWFNLLGPLPDLVPPSQSLYDWLESAHEVSALTLQGLAVLHALAALYHHFIKRDDVLSRMLPFAGKPVERSLTIALMVLGGITATRALVPEAAREASAAATSRYSQVAAAPLKEVPAFVGVAVVDAPVAGPAAVASAPVTVPAGAPTASPVAAAAVGRKAGAAAAGPGAPRWRLDAANSTLGFEFVQAGAATRGRFARFTADIAFAGGSAPTGRFEVAIDTGSADTQDKDRDQTLRSPELFASEQHPQARYVAERFVAQGSGFRAEGTLTLKGRSQPVPLVFTFVPAGSGAAGRATLTGQATLRRLDFAVGEGEWKSTEWIGNDVQIDFTLRLLGED